MRAVVKETALLVVMVVSRPSLKGNGSINSVTS